MKHQFRKWIPLLAAAVLVVCVGMTERTKLKADVTDTASGTNVALETNSSGNADALLGDLSSAVDGAVQNLNTETGNAESPAAAVESAKEETEKKNTAEASGVWKDGTYTGTGTGYGGPLTISLVIKDGKIDSIEVVSTSDTEPFITFGKGVISSIIAAQSPYVDTVSGATLSSGGIIFAVKDALDKASGGSGIYSGGTAAAAAGASAASAPAAGASSGSVAKVSESGTYKDGTYTGTGTGFGGRLTVQVTIKNGKIKSIKLVSHNDTEPYISNAKALLKTIVSKQSTNVDAVSGATYSSNGIITAVRNALSKAKTGSKKASSKKSSKKKNSKKKSSGQTASPTPSATGSQAETPKTDDGKNYYADGTYTGSGQGNNGTITVSVVISSGKIASVAVTSHSDDEPFITNASALCATIVSKQSADVDTVSGATYSSEGIITAVKAALASSHAAAESANSTPSNTATPAPTATPEPTETPTPTETPAPTEEPTPTETPEPTPDTSVTYTGTAVVNSDYDTYEEDFTSYNVTAVVTVKDGVITAINVSADTSSSTNKRLFGRAKNGASGKAGIPSQILSGTNPDSIDAVTGATLSSKGIAEAVKNALAGEVG